MQLLGRDQRKTLLQIEPHLIAEQRTRRTGAIGLQCAALEHVAHEIFVLVHRTILLMRACN